MAIITQQFLAAVFTNFSAFFQNVFTTSQVGVPSLCLETESTTAAESYNWLGSHPRVREWTDERKPTGMTSSNYTIRARDWEASIEVDRDEFLFDKLGLVKPRISGLAHEAQRHPRELSYSLLAGGFAAKAWDGKNFFADHTKAVPGGTAWLNNNLGAIALDANGMKTAFATLRGANDDRGRPFDFPLAAGNTRLIVGPKQEANARTLLNSEAYVGAASGGAVGPSATFATNIWKGIAELDVTAYITDNSWFLAFIGDADARALIFQWHKKPELSQLTNPNTSDAVFMRKKYYYGTDAIYNVGYGNFAQIVGSSVA